MRSPGAAARNLPSSRSPITVETRSLRVTADVREKVIFYEELTLS
ncbi:unnamed protein product [Toxocara canis]|uniref:Uncharacterized protein n=1 Tax=Toxocara canis TaxID=6265 RepID=A0A183VHE6_TOXCA|nr:unnamed protein product [Toxocara canis]